MAIDKLEFKPDNWLENAGIVGLTRVLHPDQYKIERYIDPEFKIPAFKLVVDASVLDTFVDQYFDYFIDKYGKYTRYQRILDCKSYLLKLKDDDFAEFDDSNGDLTKEDLKPLTDKFEDTIKYVFFSSMKSFKQIAKYLHSDFDEAAQAKSANKLEQLLKQKKTLSNPKVFNAVIRELVDKWLEIIQYFEQERPTKYYQAKLLGYAIIQNAWNNASFLDAANMAKVDPDIFKNFDKYFIQPACDYVVADHSKDNYECATCGRSYKRKSDVRPITFMNDMGYDFGKKQSNAWNLQNTLYICPICQLMYVCVPAGFAYNMRHQGIFVNETFNINVLKRNNDNILNRMLNNLSESASTSAYKALSNSYQEVMAQGQNYPLRNAQIVIYDHDHYNSQITSNLASSVLSQASRHVFKKSGDTLLESLMYMGISNYKGQNYYSIFDEIMRSLFNNTSLDNLICTLLWFKASNASGLYYSVSQIMNVILLNNMMINYRIMKGKTEMTELTEADLRKARSFGITLRDAYAKNNPKKAITLAYRLSRNLRVGDVDGFMNELLNAYMYQQSGQNMIVPSIFVNNQNNIETFKQYGFAFVAGLIGESTKKDDKD